MAESTRPRTLSRLANGMQVEIMDSQPDNRRIVLAATALIVVCLAVWCADRVRALESVRMTVLNAVSPGRLVVTAIAGPRPLHDIAQDSQLEQLQAELLTNELQRRQLIIENAQLQRQLQQLSRLNEINSVSGFDLVEFASVPAHVLSRPEMPDSLRSLFIDAGISQGLRESGLVVDGTGLVIDRGERFSLVPGMKVTTGRAVIGRIADVSRWVSMVQLTTDTEFSAAVQIVRMDALRPAFGASGLLVGTGDGLCQVTGIPYTSAVAVGDEIFSADIDEIKGPRLYYGRVVRADYDEGGEWHIVVAPGVSPEGVLKVDVIHPVLNTGSGQHDGGRE